MGDSIKVAVTNGLGEGGGAAQIVVPKDDNAIANIIKKCVTTWNCEPKLQNYALRYKNSGLIVRQENLHLIREVLTLTETNEKMVLDLVTSLKTHEETKAINDLPNKVSSKHVNDHEYLNILIEQHNGVQVILERLAYDLKTHEDSRVIGVLLETLSLIIDKHPEVLSTIEQVMFKISQIDVHFVR